ncbi:MAG: ATP-binding protein [Haloarculaceae archaeon]
MRQGGAGPTRWHVAGLVSVTAIAFALVAVHVAMVLASGRPDVGALMVDATLFGLLLYLWHWARNRGIRPSDLQRVGGWLALGTLVFGGGTLYQAWVADGASGVVPAGAVAGFAVVGASAGLLIGINDVNRLVSARDEHEERERAEKLTEVLAVLNRVLRHDVRNDAHLIVGYADLIAADHADPDSPLEEYLEKVRDRATDAVDRSEQARDIERVLFDDADALETVDLVERLEDRIEGLASRYPEAEVDLRVDADVGVTAHGLVDSALDNVLENAVEHNDCEAPVVEVRVDRVVDDGDPYVRVAVGDDGPGIPENERRVLARGTESPLEHSAGLGLWLVSWIVQASGGFVDIADREPRGSDVRLHFRPDSVDLPEGELPVLAPPA